MHAEQRHAYAVGEADRRGSATRATGTASDGIERTRSGRCVRLTTEPTEMSMPPIKRDDELSERDDHQRRDLAVHVGDVLHARRSPARPATGERTSRAASPTETRPRPERPNRRTRCALTLTASCRRWPISACLMIDFLGRVLAVEFRDDLALAHDEDAIAQTEVLGELARRHQDCAALVRELAQQRDRFPPWRRRRRRASAPRSAACRRRTRATARS